jgi:adenosine deaminase
VQQLADWFHAGAARGALPLYLEGFRHTIAVLQTAEALERVAYEFVEDMFKDGVVYAEVRFAPHFHTGAGLGLDAIMRAIVNGLRAGEREFKVGTGLIICAMRNESPDLSIKLAELAVAWRDQGCVGFDLAGEEDGNPAKEHTRAFEFVKRANFCITIHAGESFGPESIWQALQYCGAHRIGHGTRLIEDFALYEGKVIKVGTLAQYVLDHRIPIEVCLSSNVHTGATPSLPEHPFRFYMDRGFRVTLNTDNRLMSRTSMTNEFMIAAEHFGCTLADLEKIAINGMKSAFTHYDERVRIIFERIKPGYAALRKELGLES